MTTTEIETETRPTNESVVESLTGFDEIAIERAFGTDMQSLTPTFTLRALAFILIKRNEGKDDKAAHFAAMALTLKQATAMFADEEDEAAAEGKG